MPSTALPSLAAPLAELDSYISRHPKTPISELVGPYRKYEAGLRELFAQEPGHELLADPLVNVLPLFRDGASNIKVRARDLAAEPQEEQDRYIMSLPSEQRRPNGSSAVVSSMKEFQHNFSVFSESSLTELNWDNVVAAGSSVVNCLLPVPAEYNASKRKLREYYHEKFSPASDIDLFLYGLTEEEAIEKIKEIERSVRDVLLTETTTVRTKHAVTICSKYPTRHIQIVLRIYKSVSEILTGFDVDCSCAAYDGKQVYCTPRALQSYITQINHVDLSRRSPSYENRLSKYSHRGFEVYFSDLVRSRIDPTIFERSFQRTLGLARLLVLERLPTARARDSYLDKRRQERGRPEIDRYSRRSRSLRGNIKESHEDEVAEWVNEDEVSNYNTFTIPYGAKFDAKKIEKLCYTRDLLLNAEWNQREDRQVYLHRHPAFFGGVADVVEDCCGCCPVPHTEEELEIAEEEAKTYVSGRISFIKDDPGRQQIGSFNPLTDNDWTEMAYIGNTERLCQAIVDGDTEHVEQWLAQEGADPNTRDYTGRTPLHLAAMSSTPDIVRLLVHAGARLVARIADGRTALHLAAERGDVEILKILMDKSISNEAEEEEKKDQRRKAKAAARTKASALEDEEIEADEESDGEIVGYEDSDEDFQSVATGSFVKVKQRAKGNPPMDAAADDDKDEPDFYDVNVLAWDSPCSALHFAIMSGNEKVVKVLCEEYAADVLLPIKCKSRDRWDSSTWALLTPTLTLSLPREKAESMIKTLLNLNVSSAQADADGLTVFHRFVNANIESLVKILWDMDQRGTNSALSHVAFHGLHPYYYDDGGVSTVTPLGLAAANGNKSLALQLIERGGLAHIDFDTWLKSAKQSIIQDRLKTFEENQKLFNRVTEQPLVLALQSSNPEIALELLERGADPNTLTTATHKKLNQSWRSYYPGHSVLDLVEDLLKKLEAYEGEEGGHSMPSLSPNTAAFLGRFAPGTWQHWMVSHDISKARNTYENSMKLYEEHQKRVAAIRGVEEKKAHIRNMIETLKQIQKVLAKKGAKRFLELYPDQKNDDSRRGYRDSGEAKASGTYTFDFAFHSVTDVTEARKAAYIEL